MTKPSAPDDDNPTLGGVLLPMRPFVVEKIWGGNKLAQRNKAPREEHLDLEHLGEAWEVADLAEGQSVVASGRYAEETLGALVARYGTALVGTNAPQADAFPLLVKLIDASDDLSVQVHPNAAQAQTREGARPKDECWLVLDVDPGARLAHGFVDDNSTREGFRAAIEANRPEEMLRFVDVKPGDILRVSPGTVHAIGRGVFLLEIQEPSDTTYRVWDYARKGLDGKLRALHLDDALDVLRFGPQPPALVAPLPIEARGDDRVELLVDAPRYRLERLQLSAGKKARGTTDGRSPLVMTVLDGTGNIATTGGHTVAVGPLDSVVIPATCGPFEVFADTALRVAVAGLAGAALLGPSALDVTEDACP